MLKDLLQRLDSDKPVWHGAPFWAWNSKLEPEELKRQIRIFKEMGFGGFFMHSRVGMNTPYLSEDWFNCIAVCAGEAEKLGMEAWLYDEDRWPSGIAGGIVTGSNDDFRQQAACITTAGSARELADIPCENILGYYIIRPGATARTMKSYRMVTTLPEKAHEGETLAVVHWEYLAKGAQQNGESYVDVMNPQAIQKFIEVTHEEYKKRFGDKFGKVIPGIFSDEPHISCYQSVKQAWSKLILPEFQKRHNYDLRPYLPELFFNTEGVKFSSVRHDFFAVCTELFVNSFAKQTGSWCEENNLQYTGHLLGEDRLSTLRTYSGSAMRFYEHMQIPGMDLLTERMDLTDTAKSVASVARQMGRKRRMCECYGCTGWDFPVSGHKAIGDWLAVNGINFRVPHLAWYTMLGEAKRDYPASISFQSPWYNRYSKLEEYFGRLNSILDGGEEVRDVLVIHPVESCWGRDICFSEEEELVIDLDLLPLSNILLASHIDFDFGDEDILARHGSAGNGVLKIGKAAYKAVVIPELETIRSSTVELLKKFASAGGLLITVGNAPARMDARISSLPQKVFEDFTAVKSYSEAVEALAAVRRVSITSENSEAESVYYMLKSEGDCEILFCVNTGCKHLYSREDNGPVDGEGTAYCGLFLRKGIDSRDITYSAADIRLHTELQGDLSVYEIDTETGAVKSVPAEKVDCNVHFTTSFGRLQSRVFIISREKINGTYLRKEKTACRLKTVSVDKWQYSADDFNVLVLDFARCRANGKLISDTPLFFDAADSKLRTEFIGCPPRGGSMIQPWLNTANAYDGKKIDLVLEYNFQCSVIPDPPVYLALEEPDLYRITLNGIGLSSQADGWWTDPALKKLPVPQEILQKGENVLKLECVYSAAMPGLESIFLLGNFGCSADGVLTAMPEYLHGGSWCEQGLPFYSGGITYTTWLEAEPGCDTLKVTVNQWEGALFAVKLNGGREKICGWPPYEVIFTEDIRPGKNRIDITIVSHRRNSFGPFFDREARPVWVCPEQFRKHDSGQRQLVPCGLTGAVEFEFRKKHS